MKNNGLVAIFFDYLDDNGEFHDLAFVVPYDRVHYDFHSDSYFIWRHDIMMDPDDTQLRNEAMMKHSYQITKQLLKEYKLMNNGR